ncbi:alpha/beta hydrolase [Candidatus Gottesmanbacteria bacterium]|nr:alpha/beta hydrolase [Candidatus Gottesmanbacteria bacterium]
MELKINGKKVFFTTLGSGKQLLILPGWAHDHNIWHGVQDLLSRNFQVTVIDFPGFGDSQINPRLKNLTDYARFLIKVVKELNFKDFVILGHSFGGSVAIKTLSLDPTLPLRKLILVDSSGLRHFHYKKILGLILAKPGKLIFSLPILKRWHQGARRLLYDRLGETDYLLSGELKNTFKRIVSENLEGLLDQIKIPTYILWGEKDDITPLTLGKILNAKIINSKLITLKNCGHFPFLEDPQGFVQTVIKIVSE